MSLRQAKLRHGELLYLLHIPKTGGSAVFEALKINFKPHEIFDLPDVVAGTAYGDQCSPVQFESAKLVRQHQDFYFRSFFGKPTKTITMLREPKARTYSYYKHVRQVRSHTLHRLVNEQGLSFIEFMKIAPAIEVNNTQTRYLCGFDIAMNKEFSDAEKLEIAKLHLRELTCFGLMEDFSASMKLFEWVFQWQNLEWGPVNQSPDSSGIDSLAEAEQQILQDNNKLDTQLYQYAQALYLKRKAELPNKGVLL